MILVWNEGERYLTVQVGGGTITQVRATSETGNPAARKTSTTFHFNHSFKTYRIQIQVQDDHR